MTQRGRDERGASSIEYALLAAGIAAVLVLVIVSLGGRVGGLFQHTCDQVSSQMDGSATTCDNGQ